MLQEQSVKYNWAKTITPDKNENRVQVGIGAYTPPKLRIGLPALDISS